jgi:hypothetical protein
MGRDRSQSLRRRSVSSRLRCSRPPGRALLPCASALETSGACHAVAAFSLASPSPLHPSPRRNRSAVSSGIPNSTRSHHRARSRRAGTRTGRPARVASSLVPADLAPLAVNVDCQASRFDRYVYLEAVMLQESRQHPHLTPCRHAGQDARAEVRSRSSP